MVVVVGENVTCALLPPALLQAYCVPPDAVRVALCPLQIATVDGLMVAVGNKFTVTLRLAVAVQLFASVTVTV